MGDKAWEALSRKRGFRLFRNITILFTALIGLLSIILIAIGGGAIQALKHYSSLGLKISVPAGAITIGVFLLLITILGFVAVSKKSSKIFTWYLVLLLILIICQFGIGGGAYSWRDQIPTKVHQSWVELNNHDKNNLQYSFTCCGFDNWNDSAGSNCWLNNTQTNSTGGSTTGGSTTGPATTGPVTTGPVTTGTTGSVTTGSVTTGNETLRDIEEDEEFQSVRGILTTDQDPMPNPSSLPGCKSKLVTSLQKNLYSVATAGVVFAVIQLAAFICGVLLFMWLRLTKQFSTLEEDY